MENNPLLNLQADEVSHVFSYIILKAEDFSSFAKLLMIWERNKNSSDIKYVLEKMEWEKLYHFHNSPTEVTRDQFNGFVKYCVRHRVKQAMFFNSCQLLFNQENVEQNLAILSDQSGTYFPSEFAFIFFKAVYRPFEIGVTSREMIQLVRDSAMRGRVDWMMRLLEDMYSFRFEIDHLLPIYKFCPNARNLDPLYKEDGIIYEEKLWYSLCSETVEEKYKEHGSMWGKRLRLKHIWDAKCQYCTLQLILFRILLGTIWY